MGINAQTSVPKFTSGDVLTAANTNLLTNAPPVFAGTATRDAAFGGAGEKTLAEGQLCYLEDSNIVQYYDGAAWATVGPASSVGLVFISATAMAGASVSVNNCFTSTYDNYRLLFSPSACTGDPVVTFRLRLSGTDSTVSYTTQRLTGYQSTVATASNNQGTDEMLFGYVKAAVPQVSVMSVDIFSPAQARSTAAFSSLGFMEDATVTNGFVGVVQNAHTPATAYDGFTMLASTGTITGTIYLYGYAKA
jgi:hypothetical protein